MSRAVAAMKTTRMMAPSKGASGSGAAMWPCGVVGVVETAVPAVGVGDVGADACGEVAAAGVVAAAVAVAVAGVAVDVDEGGDADGGDERVDVEEVVAAAAAAAVHAVGDEMGARVDAVAAVEVVLCDAI